MSICNLTSIFLAFDVFIPRAGTAFPSDTVALEDEKASRKDELLKGPSSVVPRRLLVCIEGKYAFMKNLAVGNVEIILNEFPWPRATGKARQTKICIISLGGDNRNTGASVNRMHLHYLLFLRLLVVLDNTERVDP